jgi:hypothetical protein
VSNRKQPAAAAAGFVLLAGLATGLSGCADLGVKPWDRDLLARRGMALNPRPHITELNEHVYFAREGSSGGRTFDGGGCGCN